jgi:hypothetical protein
MKTQAAVCHETNYYGCVIDKEGLKLVQKSLLPPESVRYARTAYSYISERRIQAPISRADAIGLDRKLATLRKRLEGLGEKF